MARRSSAPRRRSIPRTPGRRPLAPRRLPDGWRPASRGESRTFPTSGSPARPTSRSGLGTGPVRLIARFPEFRAMVGQPLVSTGVHGAGDLVYVFYLAPGKARFGHDCWNYGLVRDRARSLRPERGPGHRDRHRLPSRRAQRRHPPIQVALQRARHRVSREAFQPVQPGGGGLRLQRDRRQHGRDPVQRAKARRPEAAVDALGAAPCGRRPLGPEAPGRSKPRAGAPARHRPGGGSRLRVSRLSRRRPRAGRIRPLGLRGSDKRQDRRARRREPRGAGQPGLPPLRGGPAVGLAERRRARED